MCIYIQYIHMYIEICTWMCWLVYLSRQLFVRRCMYIWLDSIYIYIYYTYTCVCICLYVYIYISVCMLYTKGYYVHARFARYKTMCLPVCIYIYTDSHTYIYIYMCTQVYIICKCTHA